MLVISHSENSLVDELDQQSLIFCVGIQLDGIVFCTAHSFIKDWTVMPTETLRDLFVQEIEDFIAMKISCLTHSELTIRISH